MSCSSDKTLSPTCKCLYPFTGTLHFFSLSFSNLENSSYFTTLAGSMMSAFLSNGLPVDSVSLSDPTVDVYSYLQIEAQIFPSTQNSFNRTSISSIGFLLNRNPFQLQYFGPFFFTSESYCCFAGNWTWFKIFYLLALLFLKFFPGQICNFYLAYQFVHFLI